MDKQIRVTCRGADSLPIDAIVEFQGALKTITQDNLDKLKRSILRHGFTAPFFVWASADNHLLDGHQRLKALLALRQEGYDMPLLPVVYIDADSEAHAKEKLLYISSQYGEFTSEGFADFTEGLDLSFEDIRLTDGEFFTGYDSDDEPGELTEPEPNKSLADKFGIPPFSVLNAREGWWQDRKRAWIELGIKSEVGRGE